MSQPDPRQKNSPWLIPMLTVTDIPRSLAFYEKAFGFTPGMSMNDEAGVPAYADMHYKDQLAIMLMREGAYGGESKSPKTTNVEPATGLYVYCDNVDSLFKQAKTTGADVVDEPADMFWGDRVAKLKDPDGHVWAFATKVREFEPETALA
jgi:PhnB protein